MADADFSGKTTDEVRAMLQAVLREVLDGGWSVHVSEVQFGYRNIGIALAYPRRRGPRVRTALINFGCLAGFHKNAPKVEGTLRFRARAFSSAPVDASSLCPVFTTFPASAVHARRIFNASGRRVSSDFRPWAPRQQIGS